MDISIKKMIFLVSLFTHTNTHTHKTWAMNDNSYDYTGLCGVKYITTHDLKKKKKTQGWLLFSKSGQKK